MKKIFYFLSATDADLVEKCSPRARIQRKTIGAMVAFGGVIASISGFMFAYSLRHVWWHGIIGSVIVGTFIILQDRAIFMAKGRWVVLVRMVLIVGSSYILSLPMKLYFVEQSVNAALDESYKQENLHRYEGVAKEDADYAERRTKAEGEIERLQRERTNYLRMRDAEATGLALAANSSGISGQGPRWRSYNDQATQLEREIQRRQDALVNINAQHAKDRSLEENRFEMSRVSPEYSFLNQLNGLEKLLSDPDPDKSGAAKKVNLILTLLFLIFESAPAIMKAFLPSTDYERCLDNQDELDTSFQTSVSDYLHQEIVNVTDADAKTDFTSMKSERENKTSAFDDIKASIKKYFE